MMNLAKTWTSSSLEEFKDKVKLIDKKLYQKKDINEEYIINGKEKVIEIIEC